MPDPTPRERAVKTLRHIDSALADAQARIPALRAELGELLAVVDPQPTTPDEPQGEDAS